MNGVTVLPSIDILLTLFGVHIPAAGILLQTNCGLSEKVYLQLGLKCLCGSGPQAAEGCALLVCACVCARMGCCQLVLLC